MRSIQIVALGTALLALATAVRAHHSGAMFDRNREVQISGTVSEFSWTNPHASFKVDVTGADGKTQTWDIEMNGPNNLIHSGWKRTTLKPGDKVTVKCNPLRDGRPGGWYIAVTLADGTTLGGGSAPAGGEQPAADKSASP
jgi:hypothetical protein